MKDKEREEREMKEGRKLKMITSEKKTFKFESMREKKTWERDKKIRKDNGCRKKIFHYKSKGYDYKEN